MITRNHVTRCVPFDGMLGARLDVKKYRDILCLEWVKCLKMSSLLGRLHVQPHTLGIHMLKMLVPELIDCLLEGPALKEANKYCKSLHDQSLNWLMKIGPQYPQEFKSIMSNSSDMRCRLETAIRQNQEMKQHQKCSSSSGHNTGGSAHIKSNGNQSVSRQLQQPTIKLKTDFTNFTV